MKTYCLAPAWITAAAFWTPCHAASISQNFETGENTTNWGSTFTGGVITASFLDPSIGGENAGGGSSATQSFSRGFRNNTAGLDVTTAYMISMQVQIDAFDGPSGGLFEIVDGSYGSNNAANLRILTNGPGDYEWQARDNSSGWQDLGITLDLTQAYQIQLTVDPATFTYSATVSSITDTGTVIQTGSLSGLAFDQNVINNNANGTLLFYIQASAGGTDARVDNINIQGVPEPSVPVMAGGLAFTWLLGRRRTSAT